MLEVPESLLEERRRLGLDVFDELWEGVLHMVPPPSEWHQRFGSGLFLALAAVAESRGLIATYETGVYASADDYRVPDLVFASAECRSARGVERGAGVVVEICSPGDESRNKMGFYASVEVAEIWLLEPKTRDFELYELHAGSYRAIAPENDGSVRSPQLGVTLAAIDGPRLSIIWPGGSTEI